MGQLCAELGGAEGDGELPGAQSRFADGRAGSRLESLSPEDESLVAAIRRDLAKMAVAIGVAEREITHQTAAGAVLDWAELVMRGELIRGNAEQLTGLMPSFVFLVALAIVGQDEALELSRRTSELIEGSL